jgi:rod shape-determining protein MreD
MRFAQVVLTAVLLAAAAVLQTVVLSRIPLPGATPDLVLVAVVATALARGSNYGTVTGFAGGMMLDVIPPADGQVGRWALVLALVGWFAGRASTAADSSVLVPVLAVALSSIGAVLGYAVIGFVLNDPTVTATGVASALPTAVLYNTLLAPFLVPPLMALARRFEPPTPYARTAR